MYRLTLIRHAKSDWPAGVSDIQRPLATRGIADCQVAAKWFADKSFDEVFVSTALRTTQTAELTKLKGAKIISTREIYEAALGSLLAVVHGSDSHDIALVGHSPGMPMLAWFLAKNHDSDFAQQLRLKYPTLGVAVLESELPFSEWNEASASLVEFIIPRANPNSKDAD